MASNPIAVCTSDRGPARKTEMDREIELIINGSGKQVKVCCIKEISKERLLPGSTPLHRT